MTTSKEVVDRATNQIGEAMALITTVEVVATIKEGTIMLHLLTTTIINSEDIKIIRDRLTSKEARRIKVIVVQTMASGVHKEVAIKEIKDINDTIHNNHSDISRLDQISSLVSHRHMADLTVKSKILLQIHITNFKLN